MADMPRQNTALLRRALAWTRGLAPEWKFHAVMAAGLLVFFSAMIQPDWSDPLFEDAVYTFKPYQTHETLELAGDWEVDSGAYRAKGQLSEFHFTTEEGPWQSVRVMLNGDVSDRWSVRLARDFSSFLTKGVRPGEEFVVTPEEFSALAGSNSPIQIRISPSKVQGRDAALARVSIRAVAAAPENPPPPVPAIVYTPLLPLALALFLSAAGRRSFRQGTIAGGLLAIAAAAFSVRDPRVFDAMWLGTAGLFLGVSASAATRGWAARLKKEQEEASARFLTAELAAVAGLIGLGLWTRWNELLGLRTMPLLPDAIGYLEIARRGTFYETLQAHAPYIREPLFPALIRIWYALLPESAISARVYTLFLGMIPVILAWAAGRKLFSPFVGIAAAFLMAANPFLSRLSASVLRDDVLSGLFLALICVVVYTGSRPYIRSAGMGIIGGLLSLLRLGNIFLMVPLTLIEAVRKRWNPLEILLVFALAVPVLLPHLAFNFKTSGGDVLYSSNVHARYYYNRLHIGEEDAPATLAAWEKDPYAGQSTGIGALFQDVSPIGAAWRIVRGYIKIFLFEFPHGHLFFGHETAMIFGLFGAWVLLREWRRLWWLPAWYIIFMFPVAVIASIHLDFRLAAPAAPMILWVWAAGLEWIVREIIKRIPKRQMTKGRLE